MTIHVNCPECGAGITVTVGVETATLCSYCRKREATRLLRGKPACFECGMVAMMRGTVPIIPGHGPLETKDASHDGFKQELGEAIAAGISEELEGVGWKEALSARRGWACACGEYNGDATFCCGKCGRSR